MSLIHVFTGQGLARLVLLLSVFALAGCPDEPPRWVEAPLVADGAVLAVGTAQAAYVSDNIAGLPVNRDDASFVRFSLDTLPGATARNLRWPTNDSAPSVVGTGYSVQPSDVLGARVSLYVKSVARPGYIRISAMGGSQCWARETQAPACSGSGTGTIANDADRPGQVLRIDGPGYFSFDVTQAARDMIASPGSHNGFEIRAMPDPGDGSWGDFVFVGKETPVGQSNADRSAHLLITLQQVVGMTMPANGPNSFVESPALQETTVREDDPDGNFFASPSLMLNGAAGRRAFGLAVFGNADFMASAQHTNTAFLIHKGQDATVQYSLVGYVSQQSADQATTPARLDVYPTSGFDATRVTWRGWTAPASGTPVAGSTPLDRSLPRQVPIVDLSAHYAGFVVDQQGRAPDYPLALTTNLVSPTLLDGDRSRTTGHRPKVIVAVVGGAPQMMGPNPDDTGNWSVTSNGSLKASYRARIGQNLGHICYRFHDAARQRGSAIPSNFHAPETGASVLISQTDFDPWVWQASNRDNTTYYCARFTLNRTVGSYQVTISALGHNLRRVIPFENLPLPVPSLQGPGSLTIAAGASSVSVAADAATPFTLVVDDAAVNAPIDDTTRWIFTSSNPTDTLPGEMQRTDGQVSFPVRFGSPGRRTLTVTSKGDNTLRATLEVQVQAQAGLVLSTAVPGTPVVGQPVVLRAAVMASGVPVSQGTVSFHEGASLLGTAPVGTDFAVPHALAAGVHRLRAEYSGDPGAYLPAGSFVDFDLEISRAATRTSLSAAHLPAAGGATAGRSLTVTAQVAVVAPGAGAPTGAVRIALGGGQCSAPVSNGLATCTLTPALAGNGVLSLDYPGDADFAASAGSVAMVVAAAVVPAAIPVLDSWMLLLLSALLAALAMQRGKR